MNPLSDSDSYYIAAAIQLQDLRVTRVAPSVFPKLSDMSSSKISVASPRSPMSPTTPRRGIVRKGAAFFSPPKAPKSVRGGLDDSPGGISICARMKNLRLSPKTPDKKTTKYSVDSPSSGRTLVMNGSQSPNPRRNMKSPTLSSSSSSMGSPMKVMQSPMKGSPQGYEDQLQQGKGDESSQHEVSYLVFVFFIQWVSNEGDEVSNEGVPQDYQDQLQQGKGDESQESGAAGNEKVGMEAN